MASFGKIANSAFSATNENTLALININFDFTLWRCNPPPEFLPVGSALTKSRKKEAETGQIHRTACKLGFLFDEIIPDVPTLVQSYGRRVSDILSRPEVNPQGTERDGPFQAFIGADCTSIWAAATCGQSAVCVHLLACMLADVWDAKTATAIWVELIEKRKALVHENVEKGKIVNPHAHLAAQQPYDRAELASWDASARSWLRRAGESMTVQRKQFSLISDNVKIQYPRGRDMYENVIITWTRGMEVLNRLLQGLPHAACDRAVIRGISAWHLYPDLLVFQDEATKISFNDELFSRSAILTVGIEYQGRDSDKYVRWSLALSHLRYYGDPVAVYSNEDLSRIPMSQLWLVAIGSIFRLWDIPYAGFDVALRWFEELGKMIRQMHADPPPQLSSLLRLSSAATGLEGEKRRLAALLVNYGWRRGGKFLGKNAQQDKYLAFFGLGNRSVMNSFRRKNDVDVGIDYLRETASSLGLGAEDGFITYTTEIAGQRYSEVATICPIDEILADRGISRPAQGEVKKYVRWLHIEDPDKINPNEAQEILRHLDSRRIELESVGEIFIVVHQTEYMFNSHQVAKNTPDLMWMRPPNLFAGGEPLAVRNVHGPWSMSTAHFSLWVTTFKYDTCMRAIRQFRASAEHTSTTSPQDALTWLRTIPSSQQICAYLLALMSATPLDTMASSVSRGHKRRRDVSYGLTPSSSHAAVTIREDPTDCFSMTSAPHRHPRSLSLSLRALEVAGEVYRTIPCATVSLQVVDLELLSARWVPIQLQSTNFTDATFSNDYHMTIKIPLEQLVVSLTREQSFACLAMFESGRFNIEPSHLADVVALCSEDSIFVTETILSDPATARLPGKGAIRHLVGNVGHAGVVCMVSPEQPRVKRPGHDASVVSHAPYDHRGQPASAEGFGGTSLHLSFTTWKVPLDHGNTGEIDQEIFLLEAVISVQERGKWVADIDALAVERNPPEIINCSCGRSNNGPLSHSQPGQEEPITDNAVSIASWDELVDPPPCIGVLQTHKNWVARLATLCVLVQGGHEHTTVMLEDGADRLCWDCLRRDYMDPEPHMPQRIIL